MYRASLTTSDEACGQKTRVPSGCDKNERLRRQDSSPYHKGMASSSFLASISFLSQRGSREVLLECLRMNSRNRTIRPALTGKPEGPLTGAPAANGGFGGGFTLIELVITISIMVLVGAIVLPSIVNIYNAGAESQSYNMLAAQIGAARALAIQTGEYTMLHVQMSDVSTMQERCCSAIFSYDRQNNRFETVAGYPPKIFPKGIAFGELSATYATDDVDAPYQNLNDDEGFTTFNLIFSPTGQLVKQVEGGMVYFNATNPIFTVGTRLWSIPSAEYGVTAVTVFDSKEFLNRSAADRVTYLNTSGEFLSINVYTGQLLPRTD